jgi:hypothetical protein
MSVEQVKAFFDKVKADSALAQKLKDAQASFKGDKSDKDAAIAEIVIPVAAEAGFNFTAEEFKAAFDKGEGEASADELDAVAGGNRFDDFYCPLDYCDPPSQECPMGYRDNPFTSGACRLG